MIPRVLNFGEDKVLRRVADGAFDFPIRPELAQRYLGDQRHHIAVAIRGGIVVGFASGVHYIHPDKPAELFMNEVGVAASHRNQGLGARLLEILLDHARSIGCIEA